MKRTKISRLSFFIGCAAIVATPLGISAQGRGPNVIAPPAESNLLIVHLPDRGKLEPDVREHLLSSQRALATEIARRESTAEQLAEAYGRMGQVFHAYSLGAAARECYLNANQLAPKDFRWVHLLAKLDQSEDHIEAAIRRFKLVQSLRPDYVAAILNLGNIYLQLNRLGEAKQNFTAALAMEQNNPAANYGLGQIALSEKNYAEAVSRFEKTLAQLPDANRIHYGLAMAYRGLGNTEKARAHLAQQGPVGVRITDPLIDDLQTTTAGERLYLMRGKLALESKRYAEAVTELQKALRANPGSVEAHVNLGVALTQTGDVTGAASHFNEALRIDSKNMSAHYNLAVLLANENKHEAAIDHLRTILAINGNDLSARILLAQELLKVNRLEEARAEFSLVADADPNNEEAVLEHAKLLLRSRDYRGARERLEKAQARYPDRIQTATLLAYLLAASPELELRDGARALDFAQRIYQKTLTTYHGAIVAMALAELGRCDEAAAFVRMLIGKAPKETAPDLLARLRTDLSRYEQIRPCRPAASD